MIQKFLTLTAAICGLSQPLAAGPDRISLLLGSEHVGTNADFEEVNPGVFFTWTEAAWNGKLDLTVGGYRNSYGGGSIAGTAALPVIRKENWGIDLFAGAAWYPGYGDQFTVSTGDVIPLAGVQARVGNVFTQVIPGGGGSVDATVSFGLTFGLND